MFLDSSYGLVILYRVCVCVCFLSTVCYFFTCVYSSCLYIAALFRFPTNTSFDFFKFSTALQKVSLTFIKLISSFELFHFFFFFFRNRKMVQLLIMLRYLPEPKILPNSESSTDSTVNHKWHTGKQTNVIESMAAMDPYFHRTWITTQRFTFTTKTYVGCCH